MIKTNFTFRLESMTYELRFPLTNPIPCGTISNNQERERENDEK